MISFDAEAFYIYDGVQWWPCDACLLLMATSKCDGLHKLHFQCFHVDKDEYFYVKSSFPSFKNDKVLINLKTTRNGRELDCWEGKVNLL